MKTLHVGLISMLVFFFLWEFTSVSQVYGLNSLSIQTGLSEHSVEFYGLDFQKDFGFHWFESRTGFLTLFLDGSISYWEEGSDDLFSFSAVPLFSYAFNRGWGQMYPYLEAGVGPTYVSERKIDDRDLGIHFQFKNILGFGLKLGSEKRHGLGFRFIHYSNADLDDDNDGISFYTLSYRYSF